MEQLLHQHKVIQGDYTTHFIEKEMTQSLSKNQKHLIRAIAAMIYQRNNAKDSSAQWVVVEEGEGVVVNFQDNNVIVDQQKFDLDLQWRPQEKRFIVQGSEETYYGQVHLTGMHLTLSLFGIDSFLQVMRPKMWGLFSHVRPPESQPDNMIVKAPMPGILVSLPISVGDQVKRGQPLLVIEAMKMENVLKAPAKGNVMEIFVQPGDTLMRDQVLVKLG